MYQAPRDPTSTRRYFSTDAGGRDYGPPLATEGLSAGGHTLSSSFSTGETVLAASHAALFLSAFSPVAAAPAVEPDSEGQVVGGFTLGPVIAHGGFSTIRRATSASTGAVVAVKIVPRPRERAAARRTAHEEAVWAALSHEHILPLFACVRLPAADCFVTQLCPASLFDILRAGVPPREDAGRMFRQVVRGLRYLHVEQRLVHRDIKLENVLVDEAGACRIADFGMARGIDEVGEWSELEEPAGLPIPSAGGAGVHRAVSLAVPRSSKTPRSTTTPSPTTTTTEFQPGSLPYAAPELLGPPPLASSLSMASKTRAAAFAGKSASAFVSKDSTSSSAFAYAPKDVATTIAPSKNPAPAQDIWALGVLLYALLVGRLPFADSFEPRLVLKILGGTYPPPANVSARTLAVLRGCLAPRVTERWAVERVDEAAWAVGGEDPKDDAPVDEDDPQPAPRPTPAPLDLDRPTPLALDRGRPSAAARRASDRVERSSSRAPYIAARSASGKGKGSLSRTRTDSASRTRSDSRSARADDSHSRSRSRSRSPGPRTPVDALPMPMQLALGLGLGFKAGATVGFAAGSAGAGPGEEERSEEGEPGLRSPETEAAGRRAGSTPPVAWRGGAGGGGAGRSRSLGGTGV